MMAKKEKQIVYDVIATLDAKVGIGKGKGFTQTQVLKSLVKHFPFIKYYYFPKAKRYGEVRDDIDLTYYFAKSFSKLTMTYFVELFLENGKSPIWIRKNLGEKAADLIYSIRQRERRRKRIETNQEILKNFKGTKEKKLNLDFIISTIKSVKKLQTAIYLLRQYAQTRTVKNHLKRYGLTIDDVIEKDIESLKHIVCKYYCTERLKIAKYEDFLIALYNQEPLSSLDRFLDLREEKKNRKAILRDRLKSRLITRIFIDKMIAESRDFEDFKAKFEDYMYSYINKTYFKGNNIKQEKKKIRNERKNIVKDIEDIDTFIKVAKKEGYTAAIRRCRNRNLAYKYILTNFGNVENFKKLLKNEKK